MEERSLAYASYWRNSLADAELGRGGLSRRDVEGFSRIPVTELFTGVMPRDIVDAYFSGEPDRIKTVDVVIRPQVYAARTEHGKQQSNGAPDIVTPLVTPAVLDRDGRLYPCRGTVVPRDLLEPLEHGSFAIGSVSALDTFLTTDSVPGIENDAEEEGPLDPEEFEAGWKNYQAGCARMLEQVCPGELADRDVLEAVDYAFLLKKDSIKGTSRHILALYDHVRSHSPSAPLFDRYASEAIHAAESCLPAHALFSARLGHASNAYPLASEQRDALSHLLEAREGEILGVNGPPGTGKTTLLLSVVASLWAKAALEEGEPPVILAASTNNQAVTNIIDAFGRDFAAGTGALAGRWLPGVKSFGAYFPSLAREAEGAGAQYQTRGFFDRAESADYVADAEQHYLNAAAIAFPELQSPDVRSVVKRIHECLRAEVRKLSAIEAAWKSLADARDAVHAELGDDPSTTQAERVRQGERLEAEKRVGDALAERLEAYLAQESIFYSLFAWLPPVGRKRVRLARLFLKQAWPSDLPQENWRKVEEIETTLATLVARRNDALRQQQLLIQRGEAVIAQERHRLQDWKVALDPLAQVGNESIPTLSDVDPLADKLIRFPIFLLTTHYWEGRWLLDMQLLLKDIEAEKRKNGRVALEKRWRRRMKLTPCIVSTFFMLPSEMKVSRREAGGFVDDYLYHFADLLIVDEAGQVLPEVAAASFALSKRAMVIGDTLQIEPMWSLPARVDIGNLVKARLLPEVEYEKFFQHLSDIGKTVSAGSVMRIAQCATRYHYDPDLPRGLFLYEHRRCFDEIIRYCNELCYHGKLIPVRGTKAAAAERQDSDCDGLPAMGYLHIDGICQSKGGGSRYNVLEAETIAAWLAERKQDLETTYRKPLDEIVGVVTPFSEQVRAITRACHKLGISVGTKTGEMTVGTVHSLQGAQRPVVIFSPVYSKHANGGFIDKSTSMLNVAVSRAKNTFLVFGDMDTFELVPRGSPRGQLAALLFKDDAQELHFEHRQRGDLATERTGISQLRDAREHDAFLLNVLTTVAREVHIVTPWIRLECVRETGALGAMADAVRRGVRVRVYTDLGSNTFDRNPANKESKRRKLRAVVEALGAEKIDAVLVWKVHSKIVIGDENVYCVGSFNWFSARRDKAGARHETSLVYRGPNLVNEVEVMKKSLQLRVARFER